LKGSAGAWRERAEVTGKYHHPELRGTVTIAGKPGKDLSRDMIGSILKQAGLTRKDLP
jgi:hypothetical protein